MSWSFELLMTQSAGLKKNRTVFLPLCSREEWMRERYGAASSLLGYSLNDYRPWFSYLMVSKMAFPKTREILNIRHKHHLDDFHGLHTPDGVRIQQQKQLWDLSRVRLSLNPFLRMKFFIRHLKERIKE